MPILDDRIKHVVVLMLENRSFDCLLGKLYPKTPGFDGLDGTETNDGAAGAPPVPVWNTPGVPDGEMTIPQMGQEIFELMLRIASGEQSKSEMLGLGDHEFVPWQIGITG